MDAERQSGRGRILATFYDLSSEISPGMLRPSNVSFRSHIGRDVADHVEMP